MILPPRLFLSCLVVACVSLILPCLLVAQSTNRQIGTQFEVTADPLVPRPEVQPCVVPLFSGYTFALFSETAQTFPFTPPASCSGPWQKVVLDIDFSENGGRQFDRTATLYLANTNLYFGTTPEPLQTLTNTWHIERDVTDYSALMTIPQTGTMVLQNCTTDCPPPYNTELTGIFTVNASLEFYPASDSARHDHESARVPDMVLPLEQSNGSGGVNLPAFLFSPSDQFSTTFTLPTNVESAYLDVVSQSQSLDEQWFACFPNDLAAINDLYGCGNTDFRETEVAIDGQPAGIAPVSPWVYTGFLPDQWRPAPGVQTLDFVPYRVNLSPFAGLLSDGNPHTVSLSIFNDAGYFSETASLLLFLDKGSTQVNGALVKNTLALPSPVVTENLQGTETVTGTIGVKSDRHFTISGYVNTSHGKVSTSIRAHQDFSSTQTINFDTVNFSVLDQLTSVQNKVSTVTTVTSRQGDVVTNNNFSFPITVDVAYPVPSATFGLTVDTKQKYQSGALVFRDGELQQFNSVTNTASASDVSPTKSSQEYTQFDSSGHFYDCQIASKNNTLTFVSRGCSSHQH